MRVCDPTPSPSPQLHFLDFVIFFLHGRNLRLFTPFTPTLGFTATTGGGFFTSGSNGPKFFWGPFLSLVIVNFFTGCDFFQQQIKNFNGSHMLL